MFLGTYFSLTVPEVDGCGPVSLWSVVLKHRVKEAIPTKNKITQQKQYIYIYIIYMKSLVNSNKVTLFKI